MRCCRRRSKLETGRTRRDGHRAEAEVERGRGRSIGGACRARRCSSAQTDQSLAPTDQSLRPTRHCGFGAVPYMIGTELLVDASGAFQAADFDALFREAVTGRRTDVQHDLTAVK